jgi:hypothetical protein
VVAVDTERIAQVVQVALVVLAAAVLVEHQMVRRE